MESVSSSSLRRRRRQLVKALPPIEQIVRGSLMETYKRCGRAGGICVDGPGHGPKRYLSTIARTGERARLGYVPNAIYPKVAEFLGKRVVLTASRRRSRRDWPVGVRQVDARPCSGGCVATHTRQYSTRRGRTGPVVVGGSGRQYRLPAPGHRTLRQFGCPEHRAVRQE